MTETYEVQSAGWTHILARSPWPERTGRRCRIVVNPGDGIYPFDKPHRTSAVILIENDPLDPKATERGWSCVIDGADLSVIGRNQASP